MSDNSGSLPDPLPHDQFEITVRGYSRSQVDDFIIETRRRLRDTEERLSRALADAEQLRAELSAARQDATARPARVELTERMAHILELADTEAKEQRARAAEETSSLQRRARQEADTLRDEARKRVDQLLVSAREQADNAVATARAQAEATTRTARAEAERLTAEANRQAEAARAEATGQAQRVLEEVTARASAIRENTEGRLADLISGHADLMRRIGEIRDAATSLAARDAARGSVADELAGIVAAALASTPATGPGTAAGKSLQAADRPAAPGTTPLAALEPGSARRRDGLAAG